MSPDVYRSSTGDLGYPTHRRDADRFVDERGRDMVRIERDVHLRERSAGTEEFVDRHGRDVVREREVYREVPVRSRRGSVREVERGYYKSPSPPPVRRVVRPAMVRRRSSLDTFDRKPRFPRYVEREEFGPPVARRYEEVLRAYPERVRETEVVRRRRSRSRSSSSSSYSSSSSDAASVRTRTSEFPKRGRTRMPARLVSKRAIIDLGYPFEEEGEIIIIQKALGRENIDEVLRLSEKYKSETTTAHTSQILEQNRTETLYTDHIAVPLPPPPTPSSIEIIDVAPPTTSTDIVRHTTTIIDAHPHHHHRSHSMGPHHRYVEVDSRHLDVALAVDTHGHHHHHHHERLVRREDFAGDEEGLVLYEREYEGPVAEVRRDRKGRRARAIRTMMKTLT